MHYKGHYVLTCQDTPFVTTKYLNDVTIGDPRQISDRLTAQIHSTDVTTYRFAYKRKMKDADK